VSIAYTPSHDGGRNNLLRSAGRAKHEVRPDITGANEWMYSSLKSNSISVGSRNLMCDGS
jgi:hypothetical protein